MKFDKPSKERKEWGEKVKEKAQELLDLIDQEEDTNIDAIFRGELRMIATHYLVNTKEN